MQHNILINKLPETVEINGNACPINTSYRAGILFEQLMRDTSLSDAEKVVEAIVLYFGDLGGQLDTKASRIIDFYACGNNDQGKDSGGLAQQRQKRIYDFSYDADYIYAAFLSQYGVDLQEHSDMHWWKFMALFRALSPENEICRIMQIRAMEISADMSVKQREHYQKLKRVYALPDTRTSEEKARDFSQTFLRGVVKDVGKL